MQISKCQLLQGADLVSPLLTNVTTTDLKDCLSQAPETATVTKAVYAIWVWAIYFTFPGLKHYLGPMIILISQERIQHSRL